MTIGGQQRETEGNNQANLTLPRYRQGMLIDESWQDDWTLYNAVVRYQASTFEFLSSTSFVDRGWRSVSDVSGFVAFFGFDSGTATAIHTQNLQEFTQEIRLTSTAGPGRLDWLAGLFFVDRNLAWHPSFPAPGFGEATGGQGAAAGGAGTSGCASARAPEDS